MAERLDYGLRDLGAMAFPLPWCWYAILKSSYKKEFYDLCPMPANHVYLSGFATEKVAITWAVKKGIMKL